MSEPVGIIYPPPDLRGIVDSTAKYVAKNGGAFEERIMREHKGKPKFSFLFPEDPFNAYYRHKVREIRATLLSESEAQQQQQQQQQEQSRSQPSDDGADNHHEDSQENNHQQQLVAYAGSPNAADVPDSQERRDEKDCRSQSNDDQGDSEETGAPRVQPKLDEYIQEKTMKLEEPPGLNFLASPASSITYLESDIIKLTSQFIATYGRPFLLELVSREQSSTHFDFLKPQHGQFPYMTNLIMQYALISNAPLDITEQLEKDSTSQRHVLDRIRMRAEWNKMLEIERKKREEAEENEKLLYSQIDWHDFVIVETLDFEPGEKGAYPPTTPDQVGTRLLIQQRTEDHTEAEEMEIDMDVESDQEADGSGDEREHDTFAIPHPPDLENINIRKDYDPKAATKVAPPPDTYFVSPITNERIPVDQIHDHVRYNLSDPRHLEKKQQMLQEKVNEETVFASGSQIQDSLKNLAERRTDIFGMNEETDIGRRLGEEEQKKLKDNKLIWDGHKSSIKKKKLN